ncbi:MAG: hypothetical protein FWG11_05310 [Promicromonosporaceae bacterium]|nr:hypothetical protein [Promicromonosporaceae bacterium]
MGIDTTTVRVARRTRDLLAGRARARGVSVAQLLADQVAEWDREEWFRLAREGERLDVAESLAENALWESTDDGWD